MCHSSPVHECASVLPATQEVIDLSFITTDKAVQTFPMEIIFGDRREDLLVPPEQYGLLSDILAGGVDIVISARLDK